MDASMAGVNEIEAILNEFGNVHQASGPIYADMQKLKASFNIKRNEMRAIHHLVEAHVPGLRMKSTLRHDKNLTSTEYESNSNQEMMMPLNKEYVNLSCSTESPEEAVNKLLHKLAEMPKEWTLVQLTSQFNPDRRLDYSCTNLKFCSNALFMTVFQCGPKAPKPFCVEIPAATIQGQPVEVLQEMYNIHMTNKQQLQLLAEQKYCKNQQVARDYHNISNELNYRIRDVIKNTQEFWLRDWRCLFAGKLVDENLEQETENEVRKFVSTQRPNDIFPEKFYFILMAMIKNGHLFTLKMIKDMSATLLPLENDKSFRIDLCKLIRKISKEIKIRTARRHPVILILDDTLDNIPWEQIDVLVNHPISRLPSFHIIYALYKEHQASIVDGYKIVTDYKNGSSVVNPGLDLKKMETRMGIFLKYWLPSWQTVIGKPPTEDQFKNMLTKSNIFTYSGHGTGSQYFSNLSIEKIRVNAVVFLFGCSSTSLNFLSHQAEMYGTCQTYLLAACPCMIGMLWDVTDLDTDYLTTEFMSMWMPSDANVHWMYVDKTSWSSGIEVDFNAENCNDLTTAGINDDLHEPDLLRAVSLSKKSINVRNLITKAGMVARGIPVKIQS